MNTTQKKHYNVVAALIQNGDEYLCMQRPLGKYEYTSLKWEFPGGKIEPGETPEEALHRELLEEMDFEVKVGRKIVSIDHEYPDFIVTLTLFLCISDSRQFNMKEHNDFRWLPLSEMSSLDWAEADIDLINGWQADQ